MYNKTLLFLIAFAFLVFFSGYSQKSNDIPLEQLLFNKLKIVDTIQTQHGLRYFQATKKTIIAYDEDGKSMKLSGYPIIENLNFRRGTHNGITGLWLDGRVLKNGLIVSDNYYIPIKYMKDVTAEQNELTSEKIAEEMKANELRKKEEQEASWSEFKSVISSPLFWFPVVFFLLLVLIGFIGGGDVPSNNSNNTFNNPNGEMFYGDGGMKWGHRNPMGGYTDTSGKHYTPTGFGSFKSRK